jgi:tetratricopeptide (TPR) repeat protein
MRQAQQAADRLDGVRAGQLAAAATRASALTSDRDRALCAVREAQAHALVGERGSCRVALKAAYSLVTRADQTGADENPATIGRHCGVAYVQAHEAYCELRLGNYPAAARLLEEALAAWPEAYRQDRSLLHAWLGLAYAADGRLIEACTEGSTALTHASTAWSARTIRTLGQLDARLAPVRQPDVIQFRRSYSLLAASRM